MPNAGAVPCPLIQRCSAALKTGSATERTPTSSCPQLHSKNFSANFSSVNVKVTVTVLPSFLLSTATSPLQTSSTSRGPAATQPSEDDEDDTPDELLLRLIIISPSGNRSRVLGREAGAGDRPPKPLPGQWSEEVSPSSDPAISEPEPDRMSRISSLRVSVPSSCSPSTSTSKQEEEQVPKLQLLLSTSSASFGIRPPSSCGTSALPAPSLSCPPSPACPATGTAEGDDTLLSPDFILGNLLKNENPDGENGSIQLPSLSSRLPKLSLL
mmetsp:Transcript_1971/g.4565  ORF Transcript_1971/g.4565 Transcript_1971/m.4565 type:complete len:269 (-) Transcript_1971:1467-2273(-)